MKDERLQRMYDYMTFAHDALEQVLKENKPDSNDLNETLEYDRKVAQLKEIKQLIKKMKNEKQ